MDEQIDLIQVMKDAGGYSPESYGFIRDGLAHTVGMIHGQHAADSHLPPTADDNRHVSGQQLCLGLRDYGVMRYGLLAKTVLNRWGIRRTTDFGKIIFAMVDAGLMRKTDDDDLGDFENVFDFDEEFAEPERFDEPPRAGRADPVTV